ncbi:MAG: hypothetical protein VX944_03570 [Myxococcota bacterium]|nr:hypothetical protein [Myxococcota bacterium]
MILLWLIEALAGAAEPVASRIVRGDDGLAAHLISEGSLRERIAPPDDAEWVLFYTGEQRGDLAPCGCATRPRGGLPRTASIVEASQPNLFVNVGGWLDGGTGLDGNPIPEAELKNQWMIKGLSALNPAAVHVGFEDLPALGTMDGAAGGLPLVSANLRGPGIEPAVYAEHNGLTFAFIGVSHRGHASIQTPLYERLDPTRAGMDALSAIPESVDRIVLFNHGAYDAAKRLAKTGRIDAVIDTRKHRSLDAPFRVGKAVWIRSHEQGLRLGELRVGPSGVVDRKIDLDDRVPDHQTLRAIADEADAEVKALRDRLFGP